MASKSSSSAGAAAGGSEEKLAPTIGAPLEDVKQKGPATANVAAAGGGEAKAASKRPLYLSSSEDEVLNLSHSYASFFSDRDWGFLLICSSSFPRPALFRF